MENFNSILKSHIKLINYYANKLSPIEYFDDLVQIGTIELHRSMKGYDKEKHPNFTVYARENIRLKMISFLRDKGDLVHIPGSARMKYDFKSYDIISTNLVINEDGEENGSLIPELIEAEGFDLERLKTAIRMRGPKKEKILTEHYGFYEDNRS